MSRFVSLLRTFWNLLDRMRRKPKPRAVATLAVMCCRRRGWKEKLRNNEGGFNFDCVNREFALRFVKGRKTWLIVAVNLTTDINNQTQTLSNNKTKSNLPLFYLKEERFVTSSTICH